MAKYGLKMAKHGKKWLKLAKRWLKLGVIFWAQISICVKKIDISQLLVSPQISVERVCLKCHRAVLAVQVSAP